MQTFSPSLYGAGSGTISQVYQPTCMSNTTNVALFSGLQNADQVRSALVLPEDEIGWLRRRVQEITELCPAT